MSDHILSQKLSVVHEKRNFYLAEWIANLLNTIVLSLNYLIERRPVKNLKRYDENDMAKTINSAQNWTFVFFGGSLITHF